MNAVKPECSTGVDDDAPTITTCLRHAMEAKAEVFKAQDFAQRIVADKLRDRVQALLWRARSALEEIDNLVTDAIERGRGR